MSISEIVNYVNRTPHNTNPNVIASMVQGANEQAVYESVEKLKQDGGVGYTESGKVILDADLQIDEDVVVEGTSFYERPTSITLSEGQAYTVKLYSDTYTDVCKVMEYEGYPMHYIGNLGLVGLADNGLPFMAYWLPAVGEYEDGAQFSVVDANGGSHITISEAETVHTIDPKYLPSGMGGGMPVLDFTDLKDAWEPSGEDETIMYALIPVERAVEAVQSIYSLFASKKYTPVTVAVQLYDNILILPCAVGMQEGGARLCGEMSFGTEGSIYVIVTLGNTAVVRPHIMLQMA